MFRIKICGITRAQDAHAAATAGADAIGLNFYPPSPRFVDVPAARAIAAVLPAHVAKVGVFVNSPVEEILETARQVGLDHVQLHGDEPPEMLSRLEALHVGLTPRRSPVIRAWRLEAANWNSLVEYLATCRSLGCLPAALLIDAFQPGSYGGTGQRLDWTIVRDRPAEIDSLPVILAGGLEAENLALAIDTARPWGVDTASGVESAPGIKDPDKVVRFVLEARRALTAQGNGAYSQ